MSSDNIWMKMMSDHIQCIHGCAIVTTINIRLKCSEDLINKYVRHRLDENANSAESVCMWSQVKRTISYVNILYLLFFFKTKTKKKEHNEYAKCQNSNCSEFREYVCTCDSVSTMNMNNFRANITYFQANCVGQSNFWP